MYSMTGYGKANVVCEGRELTIELKAVNHRFLDLNIKMPKIFSCCEDILRKTIAQNVSRGHIDVYVNYSDKSEKEKHVDIDFGLAAGYVEAARQLAEKFEGIQNDFTLNSLMRIPDVLKAVAPEEDEEFLKSLVSKTVSIACDDLNEMRRFEGEKIKDDLLSRIDNVENFVVQIKEKAPDVAEEYSEKLKIRISEALADVDYDETKFLNEVAFFIDKSNIDEEIARAERELYELKSAVSGKLRFSQSAAVSRISRKYMAVEEALRSAATDDEQPSSDERLLIAEYYLDFAILAAEKAVLESLMAIRSSMDEDRRK